MKVIINSIEKPYTALIQINGVWVRARPEEASGLLKWEIRIKKSWAVLTGEADAFTYYKQ